MYTETYKCLKYLEVSYLPVAVAFKIVFHCSLTLSLTLYCAESCWVIKCIKKKLSGA